jgi:hydroxymethylpyrimidine pyrophosphatase-like HAD family hydrolase
MFVIATDLDRTLIPNGNQPYDKSMERFSKIVQDYDCPLIYVTGRDLLQ